MSDSITLKIKASQHRQGLPLSDPEQVVIKSKRVEEKEDGKTDGND